MRQLLRQRVKTLNSAQRAGHIRLAEKDEKFITSLFFRYQDRELKAKQEKWLDSIWIRCQCDARIGLKEDAARLKEKLKF